VADAGFAAPGRADAGRRMPPGSSTEWRCAPQVGSRHRIGRYASGPGASTCNFSPSASASSVCPPATDQQRVCAQRHAGLGAVAHAQALEDRRQGPSTTSGCSRLNTSPFYVPTSRRPDDADFRASAGLAPVRRASLPAVCSLPHSQSDRAIFSSAAKPLAEASGTVNTSGACWAMPMARVLASSSSACVFGPPAHWSSPQT